MKLKSLFVVLLIALFALALAPANAVFDEYTATLTIDEGTSIGTVTTNLEAAKIVDVRLYCPDLDADSTATARLYSIYYDTVSTGSLQPAGWTDLAIGATSDGAVLNMLTATTAIYSDRPVKMHIQTSDNQAADRVFKIWYLVEH